MLSLRTPFEVLVAVGLTTFVCASGGAIELRDAGLVSGGAPVLQNGSGTVRLEDGRVGRPAVPLPAPGVLSQLGSGAGLVAFLARRRLGLSRPSRHPSKTMGLR